MALKKRKGIWYISDASEEIICIGLTAGEAVAYLEHLQVQKELEELKTAHENAYKRAERSGMAHYGEVI